MPPTLLERNTFFIKERVGLLKLTDVYDILDPANQQPIGIAREEPPGWAKYLRIVVNKVLLPTRVNVYEKEGGKVLLTIRKLGWFRSRLPVTDADGRSLGHFRTKAFSFGGGFWVHGADGERYAEVKGDWKGWNFRFLTVSGEEIGLVTKKWAGIGKELFTSADNYVISIREEAKGPPGTRALLLAAGLSIDIVFKESS
jgi:uncharacterized protein YxjI